MDVTEAVEAIWSGHRLGRATTRPGSRDHWRAVCEVHRLQRLVVAEFRRDTVDARAQDAGATQERPL